MLQVTGHGFDDTNIGTGHPAASRLAGFFCVRSIARAAVSTFGEPPPLTPLYAAHRSSAPAQGNRALKAGRALKGRLENPLEAFEEDT
jgi:hypothetical protein